MILGNVANIVLDPVMILLFGWNVAGAAVATVIGNILSGFASCRLPSPSILEIKDVPPMPKSIPTAIKNKNAGVASVKYTIFLRIFAL